MKFLELKIPPVLVFCLTATFMWLTSFAFNDLEANKTIRVVLGTASFFVGGFIAILGIVEFRKAKTTVNPINPKKASFLVSSGIYCYTRNPMYAGLLFVLIAWGCFSDNFFHF